MVGIETNIQEWNCGGGSKRLDEIVMARDTGREVFIP